MTRTLRARWPGELLGVILVGVWILCVASVSGIRPNYGPLERGTLTLFGGVAFTDLALVLFASYYMPARSVVFTFLAWCWENLPGPSGGRPGLLFLGTLFGVLGLIGVLVGSGIF